MTLARGLLQGVVLFTFAYGLVSLFDAGKAKLQLLRRVPRRGLAPVAWVRDASGTPQPLEQPDDTDIATEGLGWNVPLGDLVYDRIQVRPADRRLGRNHPLGHRTTHLAYLPQAEWDLWRPLISGPAS